MCCRLVAVSVNFGGYRPVSRTLVGATAGGGPHATPARSGRLLSRSIWHAGAPSAKIARRIALPLQGEKLNRYCMLPLRTGWSIQCGEP